MAANAPAGGPEAERAYLVPDVASGVLRYAMAEPEPETFGEMVERLRNRLPKPKRGRESFAELAGISPSTLEKIETGITRDPAPETVRRIADAFSKASGQRVPVSSISARLHWVPLDEVGSDWFFEGLDEEDRQLVTGIAGRLRALNLKAEDPPPPAQVPRRPARAARS